MKSLLLQDVLRLVRDECERFGGVRAFGQKAGISAGHISRVRRGLKAPGPKILDYFGLREITMYQAKPKSRT